MSLSYMWKSMQTSFSSEYPQKNSLKGNSTKPLNQQENIRKLKVTHEKHFFSGITVHMPSQKKSANTHDTLSDFEVVRNGMNEVSCSTRAKSIIKVSSLVKTNSEGVVSCKKKEKLQLCRICSTNLVTHCGIRSYRCVLFSKIFPQKGNLIPHEQTCRHCNEIPNGIQSEMKNASLRPDKCIQTCIHCTDLDAKSNQSHCMLVLVTSHLLIKR